MTGTGSRPGARFQLFRSTPAAPVGWRLLGGNNRPIGCGARHYADAERCRSAVAELCRNLDELDGRVDRQAPNLWRWRLAGPDGDVAVSAHPFDRQIRAQHALAHFLQRAVPARLEEVVVVSDNRRWRAGPRSIALPDRVIG